MTYAKYKDRLCPNCDLEMHLYEIKEKSEGSQDEFFKCLVCGCEKKIKVRYGQIVSAKIVGKEGEK